MKLEIGAIAIFLSSGQGEGNDDVTLKPYKSYQSDLSEPPFLQIPT